MRMDHPASFLLLVPAVFAMNACSSGSIVGKVAGGEVPAFASSLVVSTTTGDDKAFGRAVFEGFGDACGVYTRVLKDGIPKPGDAIDDDAVPNDYWTLQVDFARVAVNKSNQGEGDGVNLDDTGDIDLSIGLCHIGAEGVDGKTACFAALKGSASFTFEKEGSFAISESKLKLFDAKGNEAGEVTFTGTASNCAGADKLLEEND